MTERKADEGGKSHMLRSHSLARQMEDSIDRQNGQSYYIVVLSSHKEGKTEED